MSSNKAPVSRRGKTTANRQDGMPDEAMEKCRQYFRNLDTNHDGKLNNAEFVSMISDLGMDLDVNQFKRAYARVDQNGDGTISFREFRDAYCSEHMVAKELPKRGRASATDGRAPQSESRETSDIDLNDGCKYFWNSDKNCDGKLSTGEFSTMVNTLGMKLNQRDVRQAFKLADVDGDGFIDFDEFVKAYLSKIKSRSALTNEQIKSIYYKNDTRRKGFLTKQEFGQAMRMLGNNLDEESLDRVMAVIDKNYDGKVTLQEYSTFLGLH